MNNGFALSVRIADVRVSDARRPVGDLSELVASIREVGLLNPITVNEDGALIAGRHRLEACRVLGWETIPATSVTMDELHAELAEIDENLVNNPLTTLQRGEQLARRKALYEALHPDAKRPEGGRKPKNAEIISAFAEDAAAKTGVTPRTIRQEVQIAEDIIPEVKEMIRETPIADRKTDLLAIARTPGEQQRMEALGRMARQQEARDATAAKKLETPAQKEQRLLSIVGDEDGNIARARLRQATSTAVHATYSLWALKPEAIVGVLDEAGRVSIREMIRDGRRWFDEMERAIGRGVHLVKEGMGD